MAQGLGLRGLDVRCQDEPKVRNLFKPSGRAGHG